MEHALFGIVGGFRGLDGLIDHPADDASAVRARATVAAAIDTLMPSAIRDSA
jgi:hypothetical protein